MFQVGRYDPREEDRKKKSNEKRIRKSEAKESKKKKKKRKHQEDDKEVEEPQEQEERQQEEKPTTTTISSTLRVIAPETEGALSSQRKLNTKLTEEAFDDLDLASAEDLIVENDGEKTNDALNEQLDEPEEETEVVFDPTDEIQRALYMSRQPLMNAAKTWGLAPFLLENLVRDSYQTFFPIQSLVIPDVIAAERHSQMRARDVCVAAPTGSGKTLAFVLPVLNALANRKIRRLRALVVLPSRDLAKQVFDVFDRYCVGSDLKIGLAIGQSDFRAEQKALVVGDDDDNGVIVDCRSSSSASQLAHLSHSLDPGNLGLGLNAAQTEMESGPSGVAFHNEMPLGGISAVDVLVCTPGRLVDHLDNTPGFTLQHLRFLVVDEADRLLSQSYHGWIPRVLDSAQGVAATTTIQNNKNKHNNTPPVQHVLQESPDGLSLVVDPITWRQKPQTLNNNGVVCRPVQLRKLLYSATLTKDPQKLAALQLVNPKHFNAHHLTGKSSSSSTTALSNNRSSSLYSMPEQLQESTVECTAEQKPLVLLALLLERIQQYQSDKTDKSIIVVFTSSLESTHRLTRLLQLLWLAGTYGEPPVEFSSSLNQQQRSALMERCNDPNDPVSVVVCSDGMSRGMDIAYVSAVINYDVPGFAKTYVHRCGRTARAGKEGEAISLLKGSGQVGLFSKLRRLIDFPERVNTTMKVKTSLIRNAMPLYRGCVASLRQLIAAEGRGQLLPMETNLEEYVPTNI